MDWDRINAAIKIAEKLQYFFIATANDRGVPHVATAGELVLKSPDMVEVSFWFCPTTIDNLQQNKKVSLIIWDAKENSGYQLLGEAGETYISKTLDGYVAKVEGGKKFSQSYLSVTVRVETIMDFVHALHNDIAL